MSKQFLSKLVHHRTYANYLPDLKRREDIKETIKRNAEMHISRYPHLRKDIEEAYENVYSKKAVPSMRSLQFGGSSILRRHNRMYNCAFVNITSVEDFADILYSSSSGVGVGYSVKWRHVSQLPIIPPGHVCKRKSIPDTAEGWADSVIQLFDNPQTEFDYRKIRPAGAPLSSGGTASGPNVLIEMHAKIRDILLNATGRQLTSFECHRICCLIANCIVAGGVRRSALICLFDYEDKETMFCKSFGWWDKYPELARANNSCHIDRNDPNVEVKIKEIVSACLSAGQGEPGISLTNDLEEGFNPCVRGDTVLETNFGSKTIKEVTEMFEADPNNKIYVLSRNLSTGSNEYNEITAAALTRKNTEVITIELDSGKSITCTPDHLVYTKNWGYVKAADTEPYILVETTGNSEVVDNFVATNCDVYDISVPATSNFYGNGILVHNCHEISLRSHGFCNLTEVNAAKCNSPEEFYSAVRTATIIGTLQASYIDFNYISPKWKKTAEEDSLLGVSITGQAEAANLLSAEVLKKGAELAVEVNREWATKLGIRPAKRITTVKPSGTASSWLETTAGIHAAHGSKYIRRVRMPKDSALGKALKKHFGPFVVDDPFTASDIVIQIPIEFTGSDKDIILRDKETPIELLERVKRVYVNWVLPGHVEGSNTHNISLTVNYREEDKDVLIDWMVRNRNYYYGISLLPFDGGDYRYAPYMFVHPEMHLLARDLFRRLESTFDFESVTEEQDFTNKMLEAACAGGACTLE